MSDWPVLRRSTWWRVPISRQTLRCSRNDPSEARCSKAGQLRLGQGRRRSLVFWKRGMLCCPRNDKRRGGFPPSGGRRSVAPGMIHRDQRDAVRPTDSVNYKLIGLTPVFQRGTLVPGMIRQGRGARSLTSLSLGGVRGIVSLSQVDVPSLPE